MTIARFDAAERYRREDAGLRQARPAQFSQSTAQLTPAQQLAATVTAAAIRQGVAQAFANVFGNGASTTNGQSARQQWEAAITAKTGAGLSRLDAIRVLMHEQPALVQALDQERNAAFRAANARDEAADAARIRAHIATMQRRS